MATPSAWSTVSMDPVLLYTHQLLVINVGLAFPVCFGLVYARYVHGTVAGRHGETGESLSTNHVYPVGNVASVLRY
jgi:hypothetical protein